MTEAEKQMLAFALERARDAVSQEPDEFTEDERQALSRLEQATDVVF